MLKDACSGAWHKQELFLATPSEVHCILIAATDDTTEPYIEVMPPTSMQSAQLSVVLAQALICKRCCVLSSSMWEDYSEKGAVQSVRIASHAGGVVSQAAAAGDASAALPAEAMRCAGPVAVAGVREGILWLIDARGQVWGLVPLPACVLRARLKNCMHDGSQGKGLSSLLVSMAPGSPSPGITPCPARPHLQSVHSSMQ